MASHSVNVAVLNTPTGVPPSTDGIMGLFIKAVAGASFNLNQAYLLTQLSDLTALGINAAYDAANNLAVYQQVSEFYGQAGAGAYLWLFGVDVDTAFATYVASATFSNLIMQTNVANNANRVKMIGLAYDVPQGVLTSNVFTGAGLDDTAFAGGYNAALPVTFTAVIDGIHGAKTITLGAGGATTYLVNDVLTIVQGGASGATARVTSVSAGAVTGLLLLTAGTGYSVATGLATTGGGGTGCTINITAVVDTFKWKKNSGSFTLGVPLATTATALSNNITVTFGAILGHTLTDQWVYSITAGNANTSGSDAFPTDVTDTLTALTTAQQAMFNTGYQWSAILDGYNMLWTATPETLPSQADNTAFPVSLCVTSTLGNGVSQVGMALGRFARISVGHGFGAVADGPVSATTAFLTNGVIVTAGNTVVIGQLYTVIGGPVTYNSIVYEEGAQFTAITGQGTFTTTASGYLVANSTPVGGIVTGNTIVEAGLSPTDIAALGDSQYMFLRTWSDYPGFYWNDAATCEASELSLSSQEANRVANKLASNCLKFFIFYMQSGLPVNVTTGDVDETWLNVTQSAFYNTYIVPLINGGDISGGTMVVTGVAFSTNATLNFVLTIVRQTPLGNVTGTIQFSATL